MKNALLLTFALFFSMSAFGQMPKVEVRLDLMENQLSVGNYFVQVIDSSYTALGGISIDTIYSDANGEIWDTLSTKYMNGSLTFVMYGCNNQTWDYTTYLVYDQSNVTNWGQVWDTLIVPCVDRCAGNAFTSVSGNTLYLTYFNNYIWTGADATWTFSDGGSATGGSVSHTFAAAGTYWWYLHHKGCLVDSAAVTITTPMSCAAEYIVDTVNSFGGQVVIWNTSITNSGAASTTFKWFWGDGDSTVGAFPAHTYTNPGKYLVTLELIEKDAVGNVDCYSSYSDSLGMDAQGNLIYKNGFSLIVMDPNSIGLEETQAPKMKLYPQPSSGIVNIDGLESIQKVEVYNIQGELIERKVDGNLTQIDLSGHANGIYLIQVETNGSVVVEKCILR